MLKDVDTLEMDLKGVPMVLNNQELAKLFGAKNGEQVSTTQVTSKLWAYLKENKTIKDGGISPWTSGT